MCVCMYIYILFMTNVFVSPCVLEAVSRCNTRIRNSVSGNTFTSEDVECQVVTPPVLRPSTCRLAVPSRRLVYRLHFIISQRVYCVSGNFPCAYRKGKIRLSSARARCMGYIIIVERARTRACVCAIVLVIPSEFVSLKYI